MFLTSKQSLLSFSLLIAVSIATSWFLVRKINEEENFPFYIFTPTIPAFDSYNKTLSRHTITGVKDLEGHYKKVTVSNNTITFSFEVPDTWLTETRNSGEVEMNEEELREFLGTNYDGDIRSGKTCESINIIDAKGTVKIEKICGKPYSDYTDLSWDMLKALSYEDLKKIYKNKENDFTHGFPNGSVSSNKWIYYTDGNGYQIDFHILSTEDAKKYYGFDVTKSVFFAANKEEIAKKLFIDGKAAEMFTSISNGDPWTDDTYIYIYLGRFSIVIHKQGEVSDEFELNFNHIIETIKIE